ncbi:MAG: hypothetical protein GY715_05990 [Planctomycetes bacterium]|nr:hypothetical protein [Planctomycetota bacterium]
MFGSIIRQLLDRKLTSIKEIETVTGRGSSTIYRWMDESSQPSLGDVRSLVGGLEKPEARQLLLGLLASDLPIVIEWIDDCASEAAEQAGPPRDGHELLEQTLLALDCISHVLNEGHNAIRERGLDDESFTAIVELTDQAVRHLTRTRTLLQRYRPQTP